MGGGGSSTVYRDQIIEVRADPKLLEQLKEFEEKTTGLRSSIQKIDSDIKSMQVEARNKNNPALYHQYREQAFNKFVDGLETYNFKKPIKKNSSDERHHILIGNISSGKSSLLNKLFGLNEPVACGECTPAPKKVTKLGNVHIWDSPGINQDFKIYDPDVLAFFHCADKIFILFPDSLKSSVELIRVLAKIKPNETYLVRTQVDNWNETMSKTIQQELETDRALLTKWGIKIPVYATSAKRGLQFSDNASVKNLIQNP